MVRLLKTIIQEQQHKSENKAYQVEKGLINEKKMAPKNGDQKKEIPFLVLRVEQKWTEITKILIHQANNHWVWHLDELDLRSKVYGNYKNTTAEQDTLPHLHSRKR